jgi:uridine kinase
MLSLKPATSPQILIDRITDMRLVTPRLIIAIDGFGGGGKSTLARTIAAALPGGKHFEYDWFHLPKAEVGNDSRYDYHRLRCEVLEPFRNGQRSFEFQRYNWGYLSGSPDGYAAEPIRLHEVETIILEGCGVFTPALAECYDVKVWVDTPPDEATARGIHRDIEEYGLDPERVKAAWTEWNSWHADDLLRDNRRLRADVFVEPLG